MKASRFSEAQIIGILKEQEVGGKTAEVCRHHSVSQATFYTWKAKYGGMEVSDAQRLKALEAENARLAPMVYERPHQAWALDFASDSLACGRRIRFSSRVRHQPPRLH